jgi:cytoskeletal protein CcmA (bactofilin family)
MKEGTFFVKDTLSLKTGCSVNGTLRFKRLQVELDAKINGTCQVINEKDEARPAAPQDKAHPVNKPAEHNGTVEEK